jgi:hypothetical protein
MKANCLWMPVFFFALCSCDKPRPAVSTTPPSTEESSDEPDYRPRAPMHLERTLRVSDYPFEIRVPERWDVRGGTLNILQGPTPHGPKPDGAIHLTVTRRGPLPKIVIDALKSSSTKPATNDSFFRNETRTLGKLQIYEQRSVQPATGGVPAMMKWTISAYETLDKENIRLYQINFLDLTREQFEKDRELLESMIASLAAVDEEGPSLK